MGRDRQGTLVSYRPDIKVLDCTLRDGGWSIILLFLMSL